MVYTNNGEFLTEGIGVGADAGNSPANAISNGLSTATSNGAATHTVSWDARAGIVLSDNMVAATPHPSNCVPVKFQPCKAVYNSASTSNWTFDAAGRQVNGTGTTTTCQYSTQANPPPPTCSTVNKNPSTAPMRAYDAKNRLVGGGASAVTRTYSWGPNNHPQQIVDSTLGQETLHWDGDGLLFTTNASGQVDDLKIEDFGDVYPLYTPNSGLMLDDRDPGGVLITRHTLNGGTDYWSLQDPLLGPGYVKTLGFLPTGTFPDVVTGPQPAIAINELRSDGINDGFNTIQGVRTYEPGLNGWTTPDAYAGDISDPMSRKSYMWNDDNPISYEDPSGYESCVGPGLCGQPYNWKGDDPKGYEFFGNLLLGAIMLIGTDGMSAAAPSEISEDAAEFSVGSEAVGNAIASITRRTTSISSSSSLEQRQGEGGTQGMETEFNTLARASGNTPVTQMTKNGSVTSVELPGGGSASIRGFSSRNSRSTLQINPGGNKKTIKIRF